MSKYLKDKSFEELRIHAWYLQKIIRLLSPHWDCIEEHNELNHAYFLMECKS